MEGSDICTGEATYGVTVEYLFKINSITIQLIQLKNIYA